MARINTDIVPAKVEFNGYSVEQSEINSFFNISINTGSIQNDFVSYGDAVSCSCSVEMSSSKLPSVGVRFEVFFEILNTWVPFGKFIITDEPVSKNERTTFTGRGFIDAYGDTRVNIVIGGDSVPYVTEVIDIIKNQFGVEIVFQMYTKFVDYLLPLPAKKGNSESSEDGDDKYTVIEYSFRELIRGIALLYGCNAIERNGKIYMTQLGYVSENDASVFYKSEFSEYYVSENTYSPNKVEILGQNYFYPEEEEFPYLWGCGNKLTFVLLENDIPAGANGYTVNIECDWIQPSAASAVLDGTAIKNEIDSAFAYHPNELEISGYNTELFAGNTITISEPNRTIQVYLANVNYEWDGGFLIKADCPFFSKSGDSGNSAINFSSGLSAQNGTTIAAANDIAMFREIYANYVEATDGKFENLETKNLTITESITVLEDAKVTIEGELELSKANFEELSGDYMSFKSGEFETLKAKSITTDNLSVKVANLGYLQAADAELTYATITNLTAANGRIDTLTAKAITTDNLNAKVATLGYVKADNLNASVANLGYLTASGADIKYADIGLANIDIADVATLFADVGLIDRATIVDGHITGYLDAVKIDAGKIIAGTLDASNVDIINLNCANLTVGTINGQQIASGAIDMDKLSESLSETVTQALEDAGLAISTVNNMEIGGRNLVLDSSFESISAGDIKTVKAAVSFESGNKSNRAVVVTCTDVASDAYATISNIDRPEDGTYTLSMDIKASESGTIKGNMGLQAQGGSYAMVSLVYGNTELTTEWKRYSVTFDISNLGSTDFLRIILRGLNSTSGSVYYDNVKLEKGNKATDWTPAPEDVDGEIQKAVSIANGKNTSYYQPSQPSGGTYTVNDSWFDTDNGYALYQWDGSAWVKSEFGSDAIAASAVNAGKIAAGAVTADAIAAGAITAGKIAAGAVTAGTIAASAITSDKISALAITSDKINAGAITTEKIIAGAVTTDKLHASCVTSDKIYAGAVTADAIAAGAITAGKIGAGAITADKLAVTAITSEMIQMAGGYNLATANERVGIDSVAPVYNDGSGVRDGCGCYLTSDGYLRKINSTDGFMFLCANTIMFFITGDVVKYNMTLNLSTEAGTVAVGIYFYDESLAYVGTAYASHTISAADTDTAISGSLTIPSNLSSAKYFLVGVGDSRSTKYQIYAKKVSFKLYNGGVVRSGRFWGRELVIYKETSYTDQLNDFGVRIGNPSYINLKMGDCYIQSCFRDSDARPLYLNYKGGNVYVGGEDSDVMIGNTTGLVGQASGNLYTGKLHVTDMTTATLTDYALMVGSPSGSHVNIGGYKIQGSNGSSGLLALNPGGGSIYAGAAGATVYIGTGSGKLHTGDLLNSSGTSVMPDIATATKTAAVSTSTTAKVTKIGANGFFFCSCIGTVNAETWTTLYTLPVGYRPGATVYGICSIHGGSDSYGGNCRIDSSGNVQAYISSGASGKYISIFVSW